MSGRMHPADTPFVATVLIATMVYALGGLLWRLHDDPVAAAVRKGLEDFARGYRR